MGKGYQKASTHQHWISLFSPQPSYRMVCLSSQGVYWLLSCSLSPWDNRACPLGKGPPITTKNSGFKHLMSSEAAWLDAQTHDHGNSGFSLGTRPAGKWPRAPGQWSLTGKTPPCRPSTDGGDNHPFCNKQETSLPASKIEQTKKPPNMRPWRWSSSEFSQSFLMAANLSVGFGLYYFFLLKKVCIDFIKVISLWEAEAWKQPVVRDPVSWRPCSQFPTQTQRS